MAQEIMDKSDVEITVQKRRGRPRHCKNCNKILTDGSVDGWFCSENCKETYVDASPRYCLECGAEVMGRKFCSQTCKDKYKSEHKNICPSCGEPYVKAISYSYCCYDCVPSNKVGEDVKEKLLYGVAHALTLAEMKDIMGISRERIRQLLHISDLYEDWMAARCKVKFRTLAVREEYDRLMRKS